MNQKWEFYKEKLADSPNEICIIEKKQNDRCLACESVLDTITGNMSVMSVNKYLRLLGTGDSLYENIFDFTNQYREIFGEEKYIVAYDVFGGLFASEKTIHYFAPDTLQWEDLEINYEEFLNWITEDDITDFYEPFLWSKECDLNKAFKKIVPYKDLLVNNF